MSAKIRKPSWEFADLSWKVDTSRNADGSSNTNRVPAKLLLVFLGKCANNRGESWYAYKSIQRLTGLHNDSINRASKYLRDELAILEWEQGGGRTSNRYRLNLDAMRSLAESKTPDEAGSQDSLIANAAFAHSEVEPSLTANAAFAHSESDSLTANAAIAHSECTLRSQRKEPSLTLTEPTNTTLTEPGPPPLSHRESEVSSQSQDSAQSAQHPEGQGRATSLRQPHSGNVPQAPSLRHGPETVRHTELPRAAPRPVPVLVPGEDAHYKDEVTGVRMDWIYAKQLLAEAEKGAA